MDSLKLNHLLCFFNIESKNIPKNSNKLRETVVEFTGTCIVVLFQFMDVYKSMFVIFILENYHIRVFGKN